MRDELPWVAFCALTVFAVGCAIGWVWTQDDTYAKAGVTALLAALPLLLLL